MYGKRIFLAILLSIVLVFSTSNLVHAVLSLCGLVRWDDNNISYFQDYVSNDYYVINDYVFYSQFATRPPDSCGTWGIFTLENVQFQPLSQPILLNFYNGSDFAYWEITSVGSFICHGRNASCPIISTYTPYPTNTHIPSPTPIPPTPTPLPPTATQIPPTNTPLPPKATPVPIIPTATMTSPPPIPTEDPVGAPLPMNGYEPNYGKDSSIWDTLIPPAFASESAECQRRFTEYQCTWYVASKRPDVCKWVLDDGNAYQWSYEAIKNGGEFGVILRDKPQVGDIAVWSTGCGGTPIGSCSEPELACGHVALVEWVSQDAKTIKVDETNWYPPRKNKPVEVLDCMTFISKPNLPQQTSSGPSIQPYPEPPPTLVPLIKIPVVIIQNIWDWFSGIFGG